MDNNDNNSNYCSIIKLLKEKNYVLELKLEKLTIICTKQEKVINTINSVLITSSPSVKNPSKNIQEY